MSVIVDGVDEVRRAAREELRLGATQLKLFASGGVVFPSKSHATRYEFSRAEIEAAVEEAAARDTYVMVHVYTDAGVRRCLQAGVRSIEHANFVTEETVAMMAEHAAFFDPTFISLLQRVESAGETGLSETIVHNITETIDRGRAVYGWARKHGVPIALGTDLWGPEARRCQLRELEIRSDLDEARNIVRSATAVNAELLMMPGLLGTIKQGAFADLLVVDGDPLRDARVLCNPDEKLLLVMKDGVIYSDRLTPKP
jgi:imidazolonepropionase-like amidohydrolase